MFMIVDLATGDRLPVGGSKAEFSRDKPPRLFRRRADAVNCLACWKQGLWFNDIDQYGDGDGPKPYEGKFNVERAAKRQAMNTAVVAVRLEVLA